jgi:lipid-A-disaccharide synthase
MANLLAGRELAPEFLQDRCRPDLLAPALLAFIEDPAGAAKIAAEYGRIHAGMRHNAARQAARAVLDLIGIAAVQAPVAGPT